MLMATCATPGKQMLSGMTQHLATDPAQWTVIWDSCDTRVDCWVLTGWVLAHHAAHGHAAAAVQPVLCTCTLWLSGSLTTLFCLCLILMQYMTCQIWQAHIRTLSCGRQDSRESASNAGVERYNNRLPLINSHWWAQREYRVTWEIMRIIARNATRIDLPEWLRSEPYCEPCTVHGCRELRYLVHGRRVPSACVK